MIALLFFAITWWVVAPSALAKTKHTHVSVTGTVRLVKVEDDGDRHIRLCDAKGCAVAECIPAIPCAAPKVGQRITVKGISRIDAMHKWPEIHPVISWEPAR